MNTCRTCGVTLLRLTFHVPLLSRQMDGYDIRKDCFIRGRFRMLIGIGQGFSRIGGVGRFKWLPFMIWAWTPPGDGVEVSSQEAQFG